MYWVAQPSATRDGEPAFEHHAELPQVELGAATATVLVGAQSAAPSHRRAATPITSAPTSTSASAPRWCCSDPSTSTPWWCSTVASRWAGKTLEPGHLAYLGLGLDERPLDVAEPTRALLVGGLPFPEPVLMWWNYVAL